MEIFSNEAIVAFYDDKLKGTALGRKMHQFQLDEELRVEYWQGEL